MTLRMLIPFYARICCGIICMLFLHGGLQAQLKADFTVDKTGGCSPLTVSFTNKTSGASPNAVYTWDFGNGNTSTIADPGAIYKDEKAYTVTLTVKDGTQTSVKTQQITVYSKPAVDFTTINVKGCVPFNVTFTSNSTAGSGSIASYYWDYGDGSTQQGFGNVQPHTYLAPQLSTASLTVTNSFGCHATVQKKDIVQVLPALTASFSADKTMLCRESDPVQFTNTSAGPGTLTYAWDFGDGATSTDRNPSHIFNRKGIFTVKLTVTSSEGCVITATQSGYINVATFSTDFAMPAAICADQSFLFQVISSPTPNSSVWELDNGAYTWHGDYFNYVFSAPGMHKVKLTNTYGTCVDSAVKNIEVKTSPTTTGFIADVTGQCGAPVAVNFRDTTLNAASWAWNIDWGNTNQTNSTQQAFSYTYNQNRLYNVHLAVTNTSGCTKHVYKTVNLPYPGVQIHMISSSQDPNSPCGPVTAKFGSTATWHSITQFRWEFGDGGTSTEAQPEYIFTKPGTWQIKLNYTTSGGCTGTAYYNSITVLQKPDADFKSIYGTDICGNTPVIFQNLTPTPLTGVAWYINDQYVGPGQFSSLSYRFQNEGKYTVKLIGYSGLCTDTMEKVEYITVRPPFPDINFYNNTCDGTRGEITVTQSSRGAQTWKYSWGDGTTTTLNADHSTVSHTYTKTGAYLVILTTTNGSCTNGDTIGAYVMLKNDIKLQADPTICTGMNMSYTISNLQANPFPDPFGGQYFFNRWEYEDGTPFTGTNGAYLVDRTPTFTSALSTPEATKQQLRVILNSNFFNCKDTTNFVPIKIVGSQAAFTVDDSRVCFNTPVTFRDASVTSGSNIKTRYWNFGDGQTLTTTSQTTVTHTYTQPGTYYVWLQITDDNGCTSATPSYTRYITVTGPLASFTPSAVNVPLNSMVSFYNTTMNNYDYNSTYQWDFGDGNTSTMYSPSHTFAQAGTYTVRLKATNSVTGCSSEATHVVVVRNFNTAFNFNLSFITSKSCPPVLVRFNNTSVGYSRIVWDFGDGITVENVGYPSHIYEKPGKYIITLYGYGPNGLKGTHIDSIVVQEPKASLAADDLEGCIGNVVTLNAKADSTKSYTWDFGDGFVTTSPDSFFKHQYNTPGIYSPVLLIKDANGCSAFASMNGKITIRPNPTVNITPDNPVVCLGQATQLQVTGGASYTWSPATGLSNSTASSTLASPVTTTNYSVLVEDDIGCSSTGSVTVQVVTPVSVSAPPDMPVCAGNSVTIPATGAEIYNWINNTTGLNDTRIANPTATPAITTTYTVTGSDAHNCFTDTAEVTVRVLPLPTVDAGPEQEVLAGTPVNLTPTFSPDVIRWTWTPATYLNCSNCPNPISTPLSQTMYTLEVRNNNCAAKDSVLIKMICDEARVSIPNAFSPNGDGRNDEFIIKGISYVKHLLIFNRWGQKVFERNNFIAADRSTCWDGTLKGYPASPGTYVYFVEMQ
jgi:gliding motility-associated-like protein